MMSRNTPPVGRNYDQHMTTWIKYMENHDGEHKTVGVIVTFLFLILKISAPNFLVLFSIFSIFIEFIRRGGSF